MSVSVVLVGASLLLVLVFISVLFSRVVIGTWSKTNGGTPGTKVPQQATPHSTTAANQKLRFRNKAKAEYKAKSPFEHLKELDKNLAHKTHLTPKNIQTSQSNTEDECPIQDQTTLGVPPQDPKLVFLEQDLVKPEEPAYIQTKLLQQMVRADPPPEPELPTILEKDRPDEIAPTQSYGEVNSQQLSSFPTAFFASASELDFVSSQPTTIANLREPVSRSDFTDFTTCADSEASSVNSHAPITFVNPIEGSHLNFDDAQDSPDSVHRLPISQQFPRILM